MFDIILATTKQYGIGKDGKIPWECKNDLKLFRKLTLGKTLIMGRKTIDSVPPLDNRNILCWSKKMGEYKGYKCINNINLLIEEDILVAGGGELYNEIFTNYIDNIRYIYLSMINTDIECDTFVDIKIEDFNILEKIQYDDFIFYKLTLNKEENAYLSLLREVSENGVVRNGRNGETKSIFGKTLEFNLEKTYPLLTTKKMFFKGIFEELMFFLRGQTDSKILENKKIGIWKGNTNREFLNSMGMVDRREGIMGPMYGYQWRHYGAKYDEIEGVAIERGIDQLKNVVDMIKNDPNSRRIMMTTYNLEQVDQGVLYPCHSIVLQFYVDGEYIDMYCYNRSSDLFLGLPFNIASSSLLLILISKLTNKKARKFILGLGDCHIYKEHYESVDEQLRRNCYNFPALEVNKELINLEDMENLQLTDINIKNYKSHNSIKSKMIS